VNRDITFRRRGGTAAVDAEEGHGKGDGGRGNGGLGCRREWSEKGKEGKGRKDKNLQLEETPKAGNSSQWHSSAW